MDIGPSEAETFWTEFLRKLRRRGLRGVKLVISDAHEESRRPQADERHLAALPGRYDAQCARPRRQEQPTRLRLRGDRLRSAQRRSRQGSLISGAASSTSSRPKLSKPAA